MSEIVEHAIFRNWSLIPLQQWGDNGKKDEIKLKSQLTLAPNDICYLGLLLPSTIAGVDF